MVTKATPQPPAPDPQPALPDVPSLDALTAQLDALTPDQRKELATHPVVAGIAGGIANRLYQERSAKDSQEAAGRAAKDEFDRLVAMATDDPEAFASQFLTQAQAKKMQSELENLRSTERERLATQIGQALRDLPADERPDHEDLAKIARAIAGKSDDDQFVITHKMITDVVATRRAAKLAAGQTAERLAEERKAWEADQAAKRTRSGPAPDVRPASTAGKDEPDFRRDPRAWNLWYEKTQGLR